MSHPNEEMLRGLYADFAKGDMEAVLRRCTDMCRFHIPGANQLSGTYTGRTGFMEMVGKVTEVSGETFSEEVRDVLANDEHGAVLATHTLERDGNPFEYATVHVWHLREGKGAEFWEHPGDARIFDEAWQ